MSLDDTEDESLDMDLSPEGTTVVRRTRDGAELARGKFPGQCRVGALYVVDPAGRGPAERVYLACHSPTGSSSLHELNPDLSLRSQRPFADEITNLIAYRDVLVLSSEQKTYVLPRECEAGACTTRLEVSQIEHGDRLWTTIWREGDRLQIDGDVEPAGEAIACVEGGRARPLRARHSDTDGGVDALPLHKKQRPKD